MVNLRQAFRNQSTSATQDTTTRQWVVYLTGGPEDERLLKLLKHSTDPAHTRVTLTYVVEVQQSLPLDAELPGEVLRGENVLNTAEPMAVRCCGGRTANVRTELLQARTAGAAVVDQAIEEQADVILLACSVRQKFGRPTIGDVVTHVLLYAPCEVIVVRSPGRKSPTNGVPNA